jgi:biotin-dependent carboxylase-like uncharacterized protein
MGMKIIQAGPLTTLQDAGRFGYMAFGFSPSGAMDDFSFKLANLLAGNDEETAALEITMGGAVVFFDSPALIALTGADISPAVDGKPVPMNRALAVGAGSTLSSSFAAAGCRSYLAAAGGFAVTPVLGSRSTNLKAGIGGVMGRKLQRDDYIPLGDPGFPRDITKRVYEPPGGSAAACTGASPGEPVIVRIVPGPQEALFTPAGIRTFYSSVYTAARDSDRMGIRFEGPPVESGGTDIISDGIPAGAVQIPSSGQPLVLMRDRQTVGGYAKIGVAASADLRYLAQLVPGMPARFERVTLRRAEGFYFKQLAELEGLKRKLTG